MAMQPEDAAGRWDLDWAPGRHAGQLERYPPTPEASYAEFPLRALAFLLDVLLLWLLVQLISQGRGLIVLWYTRDSPEANDSTLVVSGLVFALIVVLATASTSYFWRVFRATPGQMILGLFVVQRATGLLLRRRATVARWLLLYAPLSVLFSYTAIVDVVIRGQLIEDGDALLLASAAFFLPLIWYLLLGLSVLADRRRGRGLHDRLVGSVVVRRSGPPA
jgi:uncharacterized RDD family membrane protein YckC